MDCLRKLQVLTSYLGQMRDTINETRESLLAETLNLNTHVRYDSKHFRFYVGFESHRCSKNIITEAEFELSDEES